MLLIKDSALIVQKTEKPNFVTFHLLRGYMVKTESDALYCQRHPRLGLERLRDFESALRSTKQYILVVSNIEGLGRVWDRLGGLSHLLEFGSNLCLLPQVHVGCKTGP